MLENEATMSSLIHNENNLNISNISNILEPKTETETQPLRLKKKSSSSSSKHKYHRQHYRHHHNLNRQFYGTTTSATRSNDNRVTNSINATACGTGTSTSTCNSNTNTPFYPRLIPRNLPFQQSQNRVKIQNVETYNIPLIPSTIKYILTHSWFHILLSWPTIASLSFLVALWLLYVIFFACVYFVIDSISINNKCALSNIPNQPISFSGAFAFSLETCTTVGYGLPNSTNDIFEPECREILLAVTIQMISSMLFNAFLTAFLWVRLARCEQRGTQVVFSNKAIIEYKNGKWLFHVRIYDLDSKRPIVESHVRLYCLSWMDYENQLNQSEQSQLTQVMRIIHPNDDHGGMLFLSIPQNVTHHIDAYSPLTPNHLKQEINNHYFQGNGLMIREADQNCGSNAKTFCPICGETYESFEQLKRHIEFNKILENSASPKIPEAGTHRDESILIPKVMKKLDVTKEDIVNNLRGKEIIVLVEGIEPNVSGTFQALHSYKIEDIVFDCYFAPCVNQINGKAVVDLDRFHEVIPILPLRSKSNNDTDKNNESKGYDSVVTSSISSSTCSDTTSSRRTFFSYGTKMCK